MSLKKDISAAQEKADLIVKCLNEGIFKPLLLLNPDETMLLLVGNYRTINKVNRLGILKFFEYCKEKNFKLNLNIQSNLVGNTILICATRTNNKELVKFLIENGADKELTDISGSKAISYSRSDK